MISKVEWEPKAIISFENSLEYLRADFGNKEVDEFIKETSNVIKNIKLFPQMHIKLASININKAPINKTISLIYREKRNCIEILYFWNNKQNPTKLENIIN